MRKVDHYTIVLENCDWYSFKADGVVVYLDGINKHFYGDKCFLSADHTAIEIKHNAEVLESFTMEEKSEWKDRISRDITQVEICYEDDTEETYFVEWEIESQCENKFEFDITEPDRHIYIISQTKRSLAEF